MSQIVAYSHIRTPPDFPSNADFVQILPVWVVAPQYFSGAIQLGVVSQSAGAFNHVLRDLSVIVNQFEQLSTFSAAIDRLSSFMTAIREADEGRTEEDGLLQLPRNVTDISNTTFSTESPGPAIHHIAKIALTQMSPMGSDLFSTGPKSILAISNFTLTTPDGKRKLISNLDVSVKEGEHMLIVGNSGAGKSSLLRAIAVSSQSGYLFLAQYFVRSLNSFLLDQLQSLDSGALDYWVWVN